MPGNELVIYHGNCYDGMTAAWVARHALALEGVHPEFFGARYGDAPPDVRGKNVDIIDFSYPRETMLKIAGDAANLTVIDHHKTAEDDMRGLEKQVLVEMGKEIVVKFDMDRSGCGMAWDHYIGGQRPKIIDLIEDRDLWRFKYGEETKLAHAYVATVPMTFEDWDRLMAMPVLEITRSGTAVARYIDNYCEKAAHEARVVDWFDDKCVIVNVPYQNASEMADRLLKAHPECRFSAGWFHRADGRVQFSLRSRPGDFNVAELAKIYGGGGHVTAAGFDCAMADALAVIE